MTTGATPRYGFVFPYGDEPLTNGDDLWQVFAKQVDDLLWSWQQGTQRITATGMGKSNFTAPVGEVPVTGYTDGGSAPGTNDPASYDMALGRLYVPHTALWEVEVGIVVGAAPAAATDMGVLWRCSSATQASWTGRAVSIPMRGSSYAGSVYSTSLVVPFPKDNWLHLSTYVAGADAPITYAWVRIAGPMGGMITD